MQPRVVAIVVVRNDERWIDRTLAALAAQTRRPDAVLLVDAASTDGSAARIAASGTATVPVTARAFPAAVARSLAALPPTTDADWLWLIPGDAEPEPAALAALLAAVEIAPSVVIAGPKLVDPDDRAVLLSFGESLSVLGATVPLVDGDLDQAQHDDQTDVLGVALPGALVRRAMWDRLGGADPGLPSIDAGLDLSVRARLAGARVVRVPAARVAIRTRPEDLGRRAPLSPRALARAARRAHLHRRLVYAPAPLVPLHWLALLPLAIVRSIGLLVLKRPGGIGGEFAAALRAATDGTVPGARVRLRRARRVGWSALSGLRLPREQVRERRAVLADRAAARRPEPDLVRASFLPGGLAVVAGAAVLGLVVGWRFLGAAAVEGGALLPLSADVGALWSRVGWGDPNGGSGPADPFAAVLAVLGSLTAWNPSFAIVALWVLAPPLAALGAWWCATRLSPRAWPPVVAAALWALAPPLLAALGDGRPGAVLAHLLLPWLVLAGLEAARSWSAAGAAALLFAATTAAAPSVFPVLLIAVVVGALTRPTSAVRMLGIPVPALVLWAPLAVAQFRRGTPLGLFADPGPVGPIPPASGWQLLLGLPSSASDGWAGFGAAIGLPAEIGVLAPAILLAPLAAVALLALFLPGARRAIPATALALLGLATAVAAAHLSVATSGAVAVGPWPGAGLSIYWFGLTAAVVVALEALGRAAVVPGLVVLLGASAAVLPLVAGAVAGSTAVVPGDGRVLPALVVAESATRPGLGVLVLTAQSDGSLAARVDRGSGRYLDTTSTYRATRPEPGEEGTAIAELAGNLSSRSGFDPTAALERFGIGFVLLEQTDGDSSDAADVRRRAAEALDSENALDPIGETAFGTLWSSSETPTAAPETVDGAIRTPILVALGVSFGFALLLAIPTGRRRRVVRPEPELPDEENDFDEDEHD